VAHCHENLERTQLKEIPHLENITFLIGPEGDFSEKRFPF
jgi:16S rRNA (uracil1498-N3)-methyltransferase